MRTEYMYKFMYQDNNGWHFYNESETCTYKQAFDELKNFLSEFGYHNVMIVKAYTVDSVGVNIKVKE